MKNRCGEQRSFDVDPYFVHRPNDLGKMGFTALQKSTSVIIHICYGVCADLVDEYTRLSETSGDLDLKHFCDGVIAVFGPTYIVRVNADDVRGFLDIILGEVFTACSEVSTVRTRNGRTVRRLVKVNSKEKIRELELS